MDTGGLHGNNGRLIVLVPDCLVSNMDLMNKIYTMASLEKREVFYLALVDDSAKMLSATRSMATLKALVRGGRISYDSRVVETSGWVAALREIYCQGDIFICQAEQQVRDGFLRTVPLSEVLKSKYQAPVRVISGFYHPERTQIRQWVVGFVFWAGLLAILAGFFLLEVQMEQSIHGITRTVLLIILLGVELIAGIAWNKMSSR